MMSTEMTQTNVRIPVDLKDRLNESSLNNSRSLSAEISLRLEASYTSQNHSSDMLRLSMRIERDLWKAEVQKDSVLMGVGVFARDVLDAIKRFQEGNPLTDDEAKELRTECRKWWARSTIARDKSEITLRKFNDAVAKLYSLPDPRPFREELPEDDEPLILPDEDSMNTNAPAAAPRARKPKP